MGTETAAELFDIDRNTAVQETIAAGQAAEQRPEEIMNRVEDILQRQAEISRLMGATIAYGFDQDIGIAAHTGSIKILSYCII